MFKQVFALAHMATSAMAQDAMSGQEFAAYATGHTLGYRIPPHGVYGTERYLPDQRVIWTTLSGRCIRGTLFESKDQICFRYDDDPAYKCWTFFEAGDDLTGYYMRDPSREFLITPLADDALFSCSDLNS